MFASAPLAVGDFLFSLVTFVVLAAVVVGFVGLMIFLIKKIRH